MEKISTIYDVGMNNGDDTGYYLAKGHNVIAIEANPTLCRIAENRFSKEISQGRCTILNVGVADKSGLMDFYLNTENHITSTFIPQPNEDKIYEIFPTKVEKLSDIIKKYGDPIFVKIDIEGMDFIVLREIFLAGIIPINISAESHKIDVFCMLVSMGYDEFKLVNSASVSKDFANHEIRLLNGETVPFGFKHNSSGPFGEDLPGRWLTKEYVLNQFSSREHTWQDVHARNARSIYQRDAEKTRSLAAVEEVELAYKYWGRYPDVAQHAVYGEHGELGVRGAWEHYQQHGRHEAKRIWGA